MSKQSFFERLTGATKESEEEKDEAQTIPTEWKIFDDKKTASGHKKTKDKSTKKKEEKKEWSSGEEGELIIDVYQANDDIVIKSTIAGVKSEDLDVSIADDKIIIKGIREPDQSINKEDYYHQEIYWGPFSRSIILPLDVDTDKARASIKNGILTIKIPGAAKNKTKTIKVKESE